MDIKHIEDNESI